MQNTKDNSYIDRESLKYFRSETILDMQKLDIECAEEKILLAKADFVNEKLIFVVCYPNFNNQTVFNNLDQALEFYNNL